MNFLSLDNYLTWCFDLTRIEIANHFKNKLLIFDAIDNLLEHDQNKSDTKYLAHMYKTANDNAQLIFTVSKDLRNKLFINHNNAYYIPNAINIREYQEIHHKSDYYRPSDLPNGPLVGYIGLMQERVNIDILKECIEKNPLINFVFVGPILSKKYFQPIKHYQNVYFLGAKHHSHIPKYLIHFDICLIPHKVNKFTKSMNPLKLYEYLAAGKEVITTSVPPSSDFKNVIHISDDKKEFSKKISECIKTPYLKFSKEEIMNSVKNEDWNIRLSEMLKHVEKQLLR
ncbi:glycosyltransferase [Niallia sp. Marseille-Q9988]